MIARSFAARNSLHLKVGPGNNISSEDMMKRPGFLAVVLLFVLLASQTAFAAAVGQARARLVAENYIDFVVEAFNRWDGTEPKIETISPVTHEEVPVFWLVKTSPSGYLLVSTRDELSPVKLYSDDGNFDPSRVDDPNAPESWIIPEQHKSVTEVGSSVRTLSAAQSAAASRITTAWTVYGNPQSAEAALSALATSPDVRFEQVDPLIQANWDQSDPYNRQCPIIDGGRSIVGCVATAWSQLLRHWKWPDRGVGSHTHTYLDVDYTVNFVEQTWDWDIMTDVVTDASADSIINEVAKLCYQVGVAADMAWSPSSSGSNAFANDVLDVYFKYKDTMTLLQRSNYTAEEWFNYFKTEFDAGVPRPVVMSIYAVDGGGHEILADGYQTGITDKVHLNMGWAGSANAYYDVTSDFTAGWTWSGGYQQIVIGIEPDYSQREATGTSPQNLLLLQ